MSFRKMLRADLEPSPDQIEPLLIATFQNILNIESTVGNTERVVQGIPRAGTSALREIITKVELDFQTRYWTDM